MSTRVLILGANGFGGGELMRWLAQHPLAPEVRGVSRSRSGKPFAAAHPHLAGVLEGSFDAAPDWGWLGEGDPAVLFAAMPHGELAAMYSEMRFQIPERVILIDLSADFRMRDAALYPRHYGGAHPCPEMLGEFVYALPEAGFAVPAGSRRIANPGCFASGLQIALATLLAGGTPEFVAIAGATGSSGSGASPGEGTHHPTRAHDFRAYKPLGHQHLAEVEQFLAGRPVRVGFVPHSAPMVRGIFLTATFPLPPDWTGARVPEGRFVRAVVGSPRVASVVGSNFVEVGCSERDGVGTVMVALDNLGKGMASGAVQAMNLALGLAEDAGLRVAAAYP